MKIRVERFYADGKATLSNVFIDNHWVCFGLEDEYRATKVTGETRIPAGTYQIKLREILSPMTKRYRGKFNFRNSKF